MTIILTKDEIQKAVEKYVKSEVLGVCGTAWKGDFSVVSVNIAEDITFDVTVEMPSQKNSEEGN